MSSSISRRFPLSDCFFSHTVSLVQKVRWRDLAGKTSMSFIATHPDSDPEIEIGKPINTTMDE